MALQYKIVTMSVGWDDTYSNTLHFDTREKQYEYFNIPTVFDNAVEVNFPVGSLVNATVTYRGVDDIQQLMNDNYCIIQNNGVSLETPQYYFYFIKQTNYLSSNQVSLSLELDVIQTYIIDTNFSDCLIDRCMVDRFISDGTDFKYNNGVDSVLLNSEGVELPKRLISRDKINIDFDTSDGSTNNESGYGIVWAYIYVQSDYLEQAKFDNSASTWVRQLSYNIGEFRAPYVVFCAPLNKEIIFSYRTTDGIYATNLNFQLLMNQLQRSTDVDLSPSILNVKISPFPPFRKKDYNDNTFFTYDSSIEHRRINIDARSPSYAKDTGIACFYKDNLPYPVCTIQDSSLYSTIDMPIKHTFTRDEILNSSYLDIEPKALSANVQALRIRTPQMNYYDFDIQKMNTSIGRFNIVESLTVDTCQGIITLDSDEDSTYYNSKLGLLGLTYNNDASIPYAVDQLAAYMAQNKNYSKMAGWNDANATVQTIASTVSAATSGMMSGGPVIAGIQGASTAVSGLFNTLNNGQQRKFTLDNMRAAPDTINNLSGSVLYNFLSNEDDISFYHELHSALKIDKEKYIDYLHEYGYSYSLIDQPKDWLNKREHFNYIQATLESITSDKKLSNQVRDKFRTIFANGITFWNDDDFNLTTNNIEWSVINSV